MSNLMKSLKKVEDVLRQMVEGKKKEQLETVGKTKTELKRKCIHITLFAIL